MQEGGKNWALEFTLPLPPGTTIRLKAFSMTRAVMNMWCVPETSWRTRAVDTQRTARGKAPRRRDQPRPKAAYGRWKTVVVLIDVDNAIIVDVGATTAIRQAETLVAKRMVVRSMEQFDLYPDRLIGDSAYGSAEMLNYTPFQRAGTYQACSPYLIRQASQIRTILHT